MRRVLLGAALLLSACQPAPVPVPRSLITSNATLAVQLRGEGDAFMAKADYVQAIERYRQAVDLEPGSLPARFGLGSAYSFLDRRTDAVAQFRWVLSNSAIDSVEYQEALRWLVHVGAVAEPAARPGRGEREASTTTMTEPAGKGSISGTTQWSGLDPTREPVRMNIALAGDEDVTKAVNRKTSIALGDPYEFKDVPEGRYRVRGVLGEETVIWDQEVTVRVGKATELVLTQAMSQSPRLVLRQDSKAQP